MAVMAESDHNIPSTIVWHDILDVAFGAKDIQYRLLA